MHKIILCAAVLLAARLSAQQPLCSTTEQQDKWFREHPELRARFDQLQQEAFVLDQQMSAVNYQQFAEKSSSAASFTIPVVFHILHTGGGENISDAQVRDAVNILTRDFNKANSDTNDVVAPFHGKIGNAQVTFALAGKDPSGNCTNGILRHWDANTDWDGDYNDYKYSWPASRYLNIYVVRKIESNAAGYTYMPGSGVPAAMDAIVILSSYVGSIGTGQAGLSRALTHEVGHWLDLPHTWGATNQPGVSCGDDGVSDTPLTKGFTSCNLGNAAVCAPGVVENMQNYMDYAYCQRMFTHGQAARMQNALNSGVANRNNLSSASNLAITGVTSSAFNCAPQLQIAVSGNYTVCAGKPLSMLSFTSNANPTSYSWTVGNGAQIDDSKSPSPTITFWNTGQTTITCVASNSTGSDMESLVVTVKEPWADIGLTQTEGFEASATNLPANWKAYKSAAQGWSVTQAAASEGSTSMYIKGESMSADEETFLETPSYDFATNPDAQFSFKYAYRRKSSSHKDFFILQASSDCGGTWQNIYSPSASQLAQGSGGVGTTVFVPAATEWKLYDQLTSHPMFQSYKGQSNVRFRFYFKANVDGTGTGNRFYLDQVNFSVPVGVNELSRHFSVNVYPNPASGLFSVDFILPEPGEVKYEVLSVSGAVVAGAPATNYQTGTHSIELNTTGELAPGIYFVNLTVEGATMSRKVIVH